MKLKVEDPLKPRIVTVDNSHLLGRGGEKVVFVDPDDPSSSALAVYHHPSAERDAKITAFVSGSLNWPSRIIRPLVRVTDSSGKGVGFSMRKLDREYVKFKNMFVPSWRRNNQMTLQGIAGAYLDAGEDLFNFIHTFGCVGDLNDGGLLINGRDHSIAWVDVDSWRVGKYPCMVGQQMYLCPTLYGIDLSTGNYFEPWHDGYSYCVLLFRALLGQHPFKAGGHPIHTDVMTRAQHGLTLLDKEVDRTNVKFTPDLVTDELMDAILVRLKLQDRTPFPLDTLRAYRDQLIECPSCKEWYPVSRSSCPSCAVPTTVNVPSALGIEIEELFEVKGGILHLQIVGDWIYAVAEEAGMLVVIMRDSHGVTSRSLLNLKFTRGMRFTFFTNTLVICIDDGKGEDDVPLFLYDLKTPIASYISKTSTVVMMGKGPIFAGSQRYLYRLAGNMLVAEYRIGAQNTGSRLVTEAFPRQCWFTVDPSPGNGPEVVFGLIRDASKDSWFVAISNDAATAFRRYPVSFAKLEQGESLSEISVRFDGGKVLVVRKTNYRGTERTRLSVVIAKSGTVESDEVLNPGSSQLWDSIHGKAFSGNSVLHVTDDGIVKEHIASHKSTILPGTVKAAANGDALYRYGAGILVVRHNRVLLITKR